MDFDPRDCDSRDDDRFAATRDRNDRGGAFDRDNERDDDGSRSTALSRDRHHDVPGLGRGPGDSRESDSSDRARDAREDARWPDRDRENRTRDSDPRDVFTRHLDLPRGREREIVRDRGRKYTLRGSESPRSQPSARFEWSPVVIYTTTAIGRSIRDPAICGTCASRG